MRLLLALLFLPLPAMAWEAYVEGPVCILSHDTEQHRTRVTHDPRRALPYAIEITRVGSTWDNTGNFAIQFDGPAQLTISTDRHQISGDSATLSVTDTGFGNVLNGLAGNHTANAILGDQVLAIPLSGAAPEVNRFRDCTSGLGA
ncbi:MAG: hypothetical protein HKN18_11285 [Silicimonas sp.]|nr:hypothetical protein [Silicimonas sp.]